MKKHIICILIVLTTSSLQSMTREAMGKPQPKRGVKKAKILRREEKRALKQQGSDILEKRRRETSEEVKQQRREAHMAYHGALQRFTTTGQWEQAWEEENDPMHCAAATYATVLFLGTMHVLWSCCPISQK